MALIITAGIFAFSIAAFGAAPMEMGKPAEQKEMGERSFNKIRVNNELKDAKVDIKLNEGEVGSISKEVQGREEIMPQGEIDKINLVIEGIKARGGKFKEKFEAKCKGKGKGKCKQDLKEKIAKVHQKLKDKGVSVTAEEEGDTFVINIKKAGDKDEVTINKDAAAKKAA